MTRLGGRPGRTALAGALATGLVCMSGCSLLGGGGPSPQDEARRLARALTSGRFGQAHVDGGSAASAYTRVFEGLHATGHRVRVAGVTEHDRTAVVRLAYRWDLPGRDKPWTYRTTVRLRRAGSGDGPWSAALGPPLFHPDLRRGERLAATRTWPDRADILGAGGVHLVTERPVQRFGIDKTRVPPAAQASSARALARRLGIDVPDYVARVRAAGDKAFVEAIVLRPADARRVLAGGAGRVRGVAVLRDTLPLAPTHDFARALLGTVGPVTAEVVRDSHGVYAAGDEAGLSGLQSRYDEQLRGTPGVTVDAVGPHGDRRLWSVDPSPGRPLRTTLDERLQRLAESTLSDVRPASALVAIRPSTGDLLAVASGPGSAGYSTATVGRYAPGSTFKVVSSLALLRSGLSPASPVSCPATATVDGKAFKNYSDYPPSALGRITLATAVADSCNTAFVGERGRVSQRDLADAAAALGLGVDHDIGFPAYFGSVPGTAAAAGSQTGHAASMIGQGRVLASPMAMAAVAASVRRGARVVPRLLGHGAEDHPPTDPLTPREAGRLRSLMRGVVTRGSGSLLADLPGPPALAKTGTAEFGTGSGSGKALPTHAWMIAVHGDLAVAAFVEVGDSGSGTAGPLLERFLRGAR